MATTPSSNPPERPTLAQLRGFNLPRVCLHRSLVGRMAERLEYIADLSDRTREATGIASTYAAIDLLYSTWLLIEQIRKVYEIVAEQVDTRFTGKRRSLDGRINNPRSAEKAATYHHRVWLFPVLEVVPDSAYVRLGLDPARSRELLQAISDRSAERLTAQEEVLRRFYDRYNPLCSAYKHGRALFGMEPSFDSEDGITGKFNVTVSDAVVTILLADDPNAAPHAFQTFRADNAFWTEVNEVLVILETQIPRFLAFIEAFVAMTYDMIRQTEAGTNEASPTLPFFSFGEPYSEEEGALMETLRMGKLRLFESE